MLIEVMLPKQMSQRDKNMVMIGANQINNTINESAITETLKQRQQQQSNATTARSIMTGSFIGAGDGFHNAEGLARVILQLTTDGSTILRLRKLQINQWAECPSLSCY